MNLRIHAGDCLFGTRLLNILSATMNILVARTIVGFPSFASLRLELTEYQEQVEKVESSKGSGDKAYKPQRFRAESVGNAYVALKELGKDAQHQFQFRRWSLNAFKRVSVSSNSSRQSSTSIGSKKARQLGPHWQVRRSSTC
jgi:hypothetical protein